MGHSVEIERLLQWAFREELPKRAGLGPRGPQSAWQATERYARLGCLIRTSLSASTSAIPHRDALIIADHVTGLRRSIAINLHEWKAFLLGDLLTLADEIANPWISVDEVDLIENHSRAGVSPDWHRYPPKAMPEIGANGKQKVYGKRYGKDRYSEGAYCPLQWINLAGIARARAEYTVWRGSLDRLARSLDGKLRNYVALPPAALPAPWTRPH
ncbi:hypothetical protein HU230_0038555 [Bradyrhizobium quebecense]|uniref:Uncharacterized protein n=1 Tax=Bradyrhizobium quebecense TaxID=2748629 RepID=A0A973WT68_9BRAD|nr:hypothetical protein [Bradyrhizobium quebecense]UGA44062.1 hypothetical protein HU230_0038555 [Bradyrhizobium quebecense]